MRRLRCFPVIAFCLFQAYRVSAVRHVTSILCWLFNVNRENCWTLLESKYLIRFPSLGLPAPFPPSLLGLWPSSMKISFLSRHMCLHQRPTTAWNSRGQFIEGGVGHCRLPFHVSTRTDLSGLVCRAAFFVVALYRVPGPTFFLLWPNVSSVVLWNQLLLPCH